MFGFFNRKDTPEAERIETAEQKADREEFEQLAGKLRKADAMAQNSAGQGIRMANSFFMQTFSGIEGFIELSTAEQMAFTEKLSGMGDKLSKVDPQTTLGFTLFRIWLGAVINGDAELMDSFADELAHITSISELSAHN